MQNEIVSKGMDISRWSWEHHHTSRPRKKMCTLINYLQHLFVTHLANHILTCINIWFSDQWRLEVCRYGHRPSVSMDICGCVPGWHFGSLSSTFLSKLRRTAHVFRCRVMLFPGWFIQNWMKINARHQTSMCCLLKHSNRMSMYDTDHVRTNNAASSSNRETLSSPIPPIWS